MVESDYVQCFLKSQEWYNLYVTGWNCLHRIIYLLILIIFYLQILLVTSIEYPPVQIIDLVAEWCPVWWPTGAPPVGNVVNSRGSHTGGYHPTNPHHNQTLTGLSISPEWRAGVAPLQPPQGGKNSPGDNCYFKLGWALPHSGITFVKNKPFFSQVASMIGMQRQSY